MIPLEEHVARALLDEICTPDWSLSSVARVAIAAAEAMRAKTLDECEALIKEHINILRQNGGFGFGDLLNVQHKIQALKGNGEGK